MNENDQVIYIVDDDAAVCDALKCLFEALHFTVHTYLSALEFLKTYTIYMRGSLIIDVRLPLMSGLELLEALQEKKNHFSIIMMSGYSDIPMVIRAMKLGACDFVLKPFNDQCLIKSVQKNAITLPEAVDNQVSERVSRLSVRERQVIDLILEGQLNKQIADKLSISISTVEVHRTNIMRKMEAKNAANLIKLYLQYQYETQK